MAEPTTAEQPTPEKAEAPKSDAKTFTQEDLDRIVQERLARAKKDSPSEDEIAALREAQKKLQEIEEANKSDLEKAAAAAQKAQEDAAAARAEADAARQEANAIKRKAAIVGAAAEIGADTEIVYALLAANDFKAANGETNFEVTIGDDGQVTGVTDTVKAIVAQKNIVGTSTPPGPGDGGARTPVPPKNVQDAIREAEAQGDVQRSMSLKSQQLAGLINNK